MSQSDLSTQSDLGQQSAADGSAEPTSGQPQAVTVYAPNLGDGGEPNTIGSLRDLLARAEDRAAWIQDICTAIGEYPRVDELLAFVMDRIRLIMDAERTTLFMLEEGTGYIWSRILTRDATREVRLALGQGIAGWVARHGVSINVRDAYKDPRFDPSVDRETGLKTRSVLAQPMRDKDGAVMGVVQVINKRRGYFSVDDELLLSAITNTAAIVIQNQRLYLEMVDRNMQLGATQRQLEERVRRLDGLYEIHRRVATASGLEDVLEAVACALGDLVASYGCAVTIVDGGRVLDTAFSRSTRRGPFRPARRTWDPAVRKHVIETGQPLARVAAGARTDAAGMTGRMPALSAEPVRSIAAVPLIVDDEVIGCVELVDRCAGEEGEGDAEFTEEDVKLMGLAAAEISGAVARSLAHRRQEMQGRLSAIGHMLSGVIHDIRSPMAIANGYVQLMARSEDADRRKELAALVSAQFAHMSEMTRELLAYARGETAIYRRTVHLHVFVDELRELLAHEFADHGATVSVSTDYRGDVRVDDGKLKRILFNLARNAREAMGPDGRFDVTFSRRADALLVDVADTGGGIPEEIRATLFDAFVTANKRGGSGLGLAIVKKLVDEHGGTIDFETWTGRGTTFHIRLPDAPG